MSTSFSTITPMNPATISKKPTYAVNTPQAQPAASTPMNGPYDQPTKKKSHWFRNTVIGAVVLVAAATVLRGKVGMFKDFDKAAQLGQDAKLLEKAAHYGKKAVAEVGDFVMTYAQKAYEWGKGLFNKGAQGTNP